MMKDKTNEQANSCDEMCNWPHYQISNLLDTIRIMTKINLFLSYYIV